MDNSFLVGYYGLCAVDDERCLDDGCKRLLNDEKLIYLVYISEEYTTKHIKEAPV